MDSSEQYKKAWDDLYGATERLVWGRRPIPFLEEFLAIAARRLTPGSRVLDAGAGEGRNVAALQRTRAAVWACDWSARGLRKLQAVTGGRVGCTRCDLGALSFRDATFDLVLLTDVIETLPDPDPVLAEAARVLKAGGMLLCNIPGCGDPISAAEMRPTGEVGCLDRGTYFYHFIDADAAGDILCRHGFTIAASGARAWRERPHPGFRGYEHEHVSNVFLGVKW
jgi:SAM-dependent methyltransferase